MQNLTTKSSNEQDTQAQDINLKQILTLIFNHKNINTNDLIEEVRGMDLVCGYQNPKLRLVIDFINQTDLGVFNDKDSLTTSFFKFAETELAHEAKALIASENLNEKEAKRYITESLRKGYASELGSWLHDSLPQMSPLNPQYRIKKQSVFQKISAFVDKFKGIGGQI